MRPALLLLLLAACAPKAPPKAPSPPVAVYALRAADGTARPDGLASVMHEDYDVRLLVAITGGAGGPVSVLLAPAKADSTQDLCAETTRLDGVAVDSSGAFQVQNATLGLSVDGDAAALGAATISGQLSASGAPLVLRQVAGRIDTRPFLPMMGNNLAPDTMCKMLPMLGPCVPCPEGGSETCWDVNISDLSAAPVAVPVVARSLAEICADTSCFSAKICKK